MNIASGMLNNIGNAVAHHHLMLGVWSMSVAAHSSPDGTFIAYTMEQEAYHEVMALIAGAWQFGFPSEGSC